MTSPLPSVHSTACFMRSSSSRPHHLHHPLFIFGSSVFSSVLLLFSSSSAQIFFSALRFSSFGSLRCCAVLSASPLLLLRCAVLFVRLLRSVPFSPCSMVRCCRCAIFFNSLLCCLFCYYFISIV